MTWTVWAALVIVVLTIYGLIKRRETRFVLLLAGLAMTLTHQSVSRQLCH